MAFSAVGVAQDAGLTLARFGRRLGDQRLGLGLDDRQGIPLAAIVAIAVKAWSIVTVTTRALVIAVVARTLVSRTIIPGTIIPGPIISGPLVAGAIVAVKPGSVIAWPVIAGTVVSGPVIPGTVISGTVVSGPVIPGTVISGTVISGAIIAGPVIAGPVVAGTIITGAVVAPAVAASLALLPVARFKPVARSVVTVESWAIVARPLAALGRPAICGLGALGRCGADRGGCVRRLGLRLSGLVLKIDIESGREVVASQDFAGRSGRLHGAQQAEVVLGVLQIVFAQHAITGSRGVPGELLILFEDGLRVAAHLDAFRAVGVKRSVGVLRLGFAATAATAAAAAIASALTLHTLEISHYSKPFRSLPCDRLGRPVR